MKSIEDGIGEPPANVVTDDIASKGILIGGQTNLFSVGDFPVPLALELPGRVLDSSPRLPGAKLAQDASKSVIYLGAWQKPTIAPK